MFHQHVIGVLDFLFLYLSCSQIWLNPFSGWLPVHPKRPPLFSTLPELSAQSSRAVEEHRENCGAFEERPEIVEGFSSARSIWLSLDASCSAWYKNCTPPPNSSFRNRFIASAEFGIVLTQEHCWLPKGKRSIRHSSGFSSCGYLFFWSSEKRPGEGKKSV